MRHVCLPCSVPFARGRLLGKHQPSEFGYYILVRAASQSLATRTVQHAAVQIHPPQADIAFGVSSLPALRVAIGRVTVPISTQSAATVGILRTQAFRRVTGYSDLFSCRHRAMSATAPGSFAIFAAIHCAWSRVSEAPIDECLLNDTKQRADHLGAICD